MDYKQPAFYHFSEDSITLAKYAARKCSDLNFGQVIDLCAGCGVVGLEFNKILDRVLSPIDFLELQSEFIPCLTENIELFGNKKSEIINKSFVSLSLDFKFKNRYDVVLCNPPYFDMGSGRHSNSSLKQNSRFFTSSSFKELLKTIQYILKDGGKLFVLVRTDIVGRLESISKELSEFELVEIGEGLSILTT